MKPIFTFQSVLQTLKNYFFITLGLAVFTFGWSAFLLPSELTGGGVSGIASLIYFADHRIPVALSTFVINGIFIAVAWKILGSRFCITTGICTAIVSAGFAVFHVLFDLFRRRVRGEIDGILFHLTRRQHRAHDGISLFVHRRDKRRLLF